MDIVFPELDTAPVAAGVAVIRVLVAAVAAGKSFTHARDAGTDLPIARADAVAETAAGAVVVTNLEIAVSATPARVTAVSNGVRSVSHAGTTSRARVRPGAV